MDKANDERGDMEEKRKEPRVPMETSLAFQVPGEHTLRSAIVINGSLSGLLIQSFNSVPIGATMKIKALFSAGPGSKEQFTAMAEVVWKDLYLWEDLEGYQYGLRFVDLSNEECFKLKRLLDHQSNIALGHPS